MQNLLHNSARNSIYRYEILLAVVALYCLKQCIRVQKFALLPGTCDPRFQFIYIEAGEIVEAISAPNQNGHILIRHDGHSYRAWKEELQNAHIAERLIPTRHSQRHAEQENR